MGRLITTVGFLALVLPAYASEPAAAPAHGVPAGHGIAGASSPAPSVTLHNLIEGNRRFVSGRPAAKHFRARRQELVGGQRPPAIVLGCADSRIPPEHVFGQGLGDIFVVRTAGNVCDDIALGSIEYAVEHLNSGLLVVLWHEACGAVKATIEAAQAGQPAPAEPGSHIAAIVGRIMPAVESTVSGPGGDATYVSRCIVSNAVYSARDLIARSAVLRHAMVQGRLAVVVGYYELGSGQGQVVLDAGVCARMARTAGETGA